MTIPENAKYVEPRGRFHVNTYSSDEETPKETTKPVILAQKTLGSSQTKSSSKSLEKDKVSYGPESRKKKEKVIKTAKNSDEIAEKVLTSSDHSSDEATEEGYIINESEEGKIGCFCFAKIIRGISEYRANVIQAEADQRLKKAQVSELDKAKKTWKPTRFCFLGVCKVKGYLAGENPPDKRSYYYGLFHEHQKTVPFGYRDGSNNCVFFPLVEEDGKIMVPTTSFTIYSQDRKTAIVLNLTQCKSTVEDGWKTDHPSKHIHNITCRHNKTADLSSLNLHTLTPDMRYEGPVSYVGAPLKNNTIGVIWGESTINY